MKYFDETHENEAEAVKNGERDIITSEMLELYLGSDNTNAEAWEMLLDILNNIWPVYDARNEIDEHYKQELGL